MATATVPAGSTCAQTIDEHRVEPPDPHLAWAAEARTLQTRYRLVTDEEADRLSEQVCRLHCRIGETPARTLAGAREQLAVADRLLGEPDRPPVTIDHTAVRNALATLDRLLERQGDATDG